MSDNTLNVLDRDSTQPDSLQGRFSNDDQFAVRLRGFGPIGILAILVILAGNLLFLPLSGILVLAWVWRSGTPWSAIGYLHPKSWIASAAFGIAFGVVFKLAMKAIVMPLLGAPPVNPVYHYLAGNAAALPAVLYAIIFGAGFGEETVFRGYMFERFGRLFGNSTWAKVLIVLLTSLLFGAAHYADQGVPGVEQAIVTGLVFGSIFAVCGRLWPVVCAHAAFDLTAVAIIYWDIESTVSHWVFG